MSVNVAAIREALSNATGGPWAKSDGRWADWPSLYVGTKTSERNASQRVVTCPWRPESERDAELIVLLRNNAETLLDEIDRLRVASEGVDMLVAQAERRGAEEHGPNAWAAVEVAWNLGHMVGSQGLDWENPYTRDTEAAKKLIEAIRVYSTKADL